MYEGQKERLQNFYSSSKLLLGPFYIGSINYQFNSLFCEWKVKHYSTYEPHNDISVKDKLHI